MENMKGAVLLCLLGSSLLQANRFSWIGPSKSMDIFDSRDNVCLTDQTSCGCCLMQQQIQRVETFFNQSLNKLETELAKTRNALDNFRASRSAFSVALTNQPGWFCLGPFNDDKVVTYKDEFINLGNGYNVDSGVFTVPRSGVYSIALTVYSGGTIPPNALTVCASLQVNGVVVARPKEQNTQDKEDSATVVLSLHLNAGDQVAVVLPAGCSLCDNKSHYNTFTGFLLYATT
ncbi:cerebellin 20 [Cynoglossus semilaevis]|nr:complement C1q-like protein 4 [Cynoglossus semilaevis]